MQDRLGISKEEIRREIEKAQETFKVVVDKAEEALDTGRQYVRENSLAVIVGALLLGIIVGVLLAPRPRKEPDAVQTVRDWLEGTREDFAKRWPQAKKQAKAIQEDIVDQAQTVGKKLQEDIVDQAQTLGKKLHLWGILSSAGGCGEDGPAQPPEVRGRGGAIPLGISVPVP